MNRSAFYSLFPKFFYSAIFILITSILSSQVPAIMSFSPTSGPVGTAVTITGTNFDATPANNIVWFGAVRATVTAATSTELTVTVPTGTTYKPLSVTVAGNTAYSSKPFIITFTSTHIIDAQAFASSFFFGTSPGPWDLTEGDIDGDGKPDVILIKSLYDIFTVYKNTSITGYITATSLAETFDFSTGSNPICTDIGDLDGDGKLDLVVTNNSDGTISIYRNTSTTGSVTFDAKVDFTIGSNPYDVIIGDIDGDGKPDLAVTNNGNNTVSILRNTSTPGSITSGSFAAKVDFLTGTNPSCVALSDIDGDGKPDLIVNNLDDNTVSVFRNISTPGSIAPGSFASSIDFVTGSRPYGVAVGDLDGDGKKDLVVTNNSSNTVSIFRNTSISGSITSGSLASRVDFTTDVNPYSIFISDIDGDGRPDLAVAGYGAGVSILRNTSISGSITNSSFAAKVDFGAPPGPANAVIGDFDGDGKPDLLVASNQWAYIGVILNTLSQPVPPVITSFTPTSGPVGTTVTITGSNFSITASENIVWFGAVQAEVTAASSTELTVSVPAGATYQPISVTVKGYTAWSDTPFDITFPVIRPVDASAFASSTDFSTGTYPWNVAVGDIDGDGKPDMAVTNVSSNSVSVYRNTSNSGSIVSSSFSEKVDFTTGGGPYGVALQDIDGDGKLDLVVASAVDEVVSIFRNTGVSGSITLASFGDRVNFSGGYGGSNSVTFSDIDGDGKPDMVFQDSHSNIFFVSRNISTPGSIVEGSFEARVDFNPGTSLYDVAVADIDGDGKPDIAVTDNTGNTVSVFRNTSTSGTINPASFDAKVDFMTGSGPKDMIFGDIDDDGKPDMIVVNNNDLSVSVFRNTSTSGLINSGSFDAKVDYATGTSPIGASIGDIDGDGKQDLVIANFGSSTISVFRNTSTPGFMTAGSLASKVDLPTGAGPVGVVVADIDGDGRPDLTVVNSNTNTVSVIRNRISDPYPPVITSFTPTSGPIGTTVTITGTHFDTTPANNIVWFGAVQAMVTAASETELTVTVPTGASFRLITVTADGLTAYSSEPFNITFPSTKIIDETAFDAKVDFTPGSASFSIAIGDIDVDGKPDMVVTNWGGNTVSVYKNISTSGSISEGSFAPKVDLITGTGPHGVAIGDIDGDGRPDIIVVNAWSNSVSVFRNISSTGSITAGSFDSRVDFSTGAVSFGIAIGDIDGDGKTDMAVTNNSINTVSVFHNTSTSGTIDASSFASKVDFTTGSSPNGVVINDIDGDGKPDLIVATSSSNTVSIFRNAGVVGSITTSSFETRVDFTTVNSYGVAIGDLDGDNKPDLVVTNNGGASVSIFRNISASGSITTGSFAAKVEFSTGTNLYYVAIGDIDGDGKPDIAVANTGNNSITVLKNACVSGSITTSSFAPRVDFTTGTQPFAVAIGDIDGDGKPDLVATNYGSSTVSVLRNTISPPIPPVITSFTPTSGPVGTSVTITGTNFSAIPAKNIVWFGAVKATVTAASATELTVTVPVGATYQPITVTDKGMTAYSSAPFIVTFPGTEAIDSNSLISKVDFTAGANPESVAIGDIDGDGKSDLIITNISSNTVSVFRNTSIRGFITTGSFSAKVDFVTGSMPKSVAIGDIDGDGKSDMVVANSDDNTVSVFRNISTPGSVNSGSFDARVDFITGTNPSDVAIADIDGDGKSDLIITNSDNTVSVLRNTSALGYITTDSFATKVDFTTGLAPQCVAISDIDGDSKPDIAVTNIGSNTISVLRNISTSGSIIAGSFEPKVDFTTGNKPFGIATGDIDGDNKSDLVVTNSDDATVSVYRNTSTSGSITAGSLAAKVDFITGMSPQAIAISYIDGDNKPDLAVTNVGSNTVSLFRNLSIAGSVTTSSFATKVDFSTSSGPRVVIGDIDGDSRPDLVVANLGENSVSVIRNRISDPYPPVITSFTPASGPVGTTVTITGTNFDATPANNIVWFGAVRAIVTAATTTELKVTVPTGTTYQPISVTAGGLTAYTSKPWDVSFSSIRNFDTQSLDTRIDFPAGSEPYAGSVCDIDVDGKPDLIFVNRESDNVSILRNVTDMYPWSGSSFEARYNMDAGEYPVSVATGDIDGDGKKDIVVANFSSNTISVFRNTSIPGTFGPGSFAAKVDFTAGGNPWCVIIADIDIDGKPDLIFTNYTTNTVSILKNTCTVGTIDSGSFAARVDFSTGVDPRFVVLGHIDTDGKPDLVVSNYADNTISVLRNKITAGTIDFMSFDTRVNFTTGMNPYAVAVEDIDINGWPDVIVSNLSDNSISIFSNAGLAGDIVPGSLNDRVNFSTGAHPMSFSIGDLDGDGKRDIAVANQFSNSISLLRNTSIPGTINSGSLAEKVDFTTWTYPSWIGLCDFNRDSKPDIAVLNANSNVVSFFRNKIPEPPPPVISSFTPASGPVGTAVTITGTNFRAEPTENIVWFGAVQAMVTSATSTQLIVTVPTGAAYKPITVTANGVTGYSNKPFNVTFLSTRIIDAAAFAAKVDFPTGTMPVYVTIGDIDGDGKPDLAIANINSNSVSVFRNTSTSGYITAGSFATRVDFTTGTFPRSVAIDDIDGDGKLDLIVTNSGSNSVSVLRNICTPGSITTGSFTEKVDFSTGINPFCAAVRDIDGDGKPDLVITNYDDNNISVFRNTGNTGSITTGSFAGKVDFTTGTAPYGVAIGDIDGDSKPDLTVANYTSSTVSIFRNTSTSGTINVSSFASKFDLEPGAGTGPVGVAISDIDGDGKPDLAVTNNTNASVSVFRNTSTYGYIGAGSFATKVDFTTGSYPYYLSIGDIDGDGKPDIAVANSGDNSVSVLRNMSTYGTIGAGSFAATVDFNAGVGSYGLALGDIDGDGKPDLAVANSSGNTVSVLRNTIPEPVPPVITSFTPVSGPVGTSVAITGSNFSTTTANNIVWFGAVQATVTAATPTLLNVTVPAGATYHPITVTVNGLTAYSNTPFIITFPGTQIIDGYSFTEKIDLTTGPNPNDAAVADIDGDGKPDLFVANTSGNSFSAFRNISASGSISAGSFEPRLDFITGMNPNCITIGDLDGDGKQDLIVANGSESSISIYRNTGTTGSFSAGSFDARVNLPAGNNPHDIAIGDIDGDSKPDLVVSNFNSSTVTIYRNISIPGSITAGSFAPRFDFTAELYLQDIVLADIDGDKKPDLIAPNFYSGTVSVYRNNSVMGSITASSFAAKVEFATGTNPLGIAVGDLDGDGKPEMIVASNSVSNVSVFHNISTPGSITSGSFDPKIDFNSGGGGYVAIGDINGDAKPDLVFKNGNSSVSVLKNTATTGSIGTDSFASGIQFWASGGTSEIIVGDLDCDGKPDLVYMDGASNIVSILRNRISEPIPPTITSFNPAQGIAGTIVTINGSNFSTTLAENTVMFGTVQASVTAATAAQLTVTVPTGATTQLISVTVNGLTAYTSTSFIVAYPPAITSFSPASGPVGTTVTIEGANFGTTPADNMVLFGTVQATVISATAAQLTILVPAGATTQLISVTVNGFPTLSGTSFIVTAPPSDPPVISSFSPGSGPVGTTVTINGSNFSTFISNNIVRFGTVQAAVISATATQLTVIVPAGATSQPIYLTIDAVTAYTGTSFIVTSAPVITSFNPASGPVGTTVTIEGINFGSGPADNIVLFGTVQATVTAATATQLTVIVPSGAITQPITVTVSGLTTISVTSFTVTAPPPDPPVISSFNPTSGLVGTTVTIDGSNFSTNTSNNIVKFGSVQAMVTSATPTQLTVIVPAGATSQPIYVTVNAITAYTSTSFIVTSPPVITSFNPTSGPVGTTVTIEGTNFSTVPAENLVLIGTIQATVTAATPTQLTAIVPIAPPGAGTMPIYVTVNGLTATSVTYFTVTVPPAIMFFNPTSGPVGTTVTITGSNFSTNISNNIVRFGTAQAAVISATETQLTVIVPAEAMTDTISLTVNGLTAYSGTSFTVTHTPVIAFFNPTSGPAGTSVTIDGAYFGNSTTDNIVKFGGVEASITSATSTQLVVTVPVRDPGQMNISVTVNGLTANSGSAFTITTLPPIINSFTPSSGPVGTSVSISGSNFSPNGSDNIVRFGVLQANIISFTETQLVVTVPNGASNGPISVTVNNQTANSSSPFIVTQPPVVTGINPTSGPVGTTVTINGSNFSPTPEDNIVMFGDVQATVTGASQNQLTVLVPVGADGQSISVTVYGQTAYFDVSFTVTTPQDIELESAILTLNGDGINDRFVVKNFQAYGASKFYVYNGRGALVYWNDDFQGEWDVTLHNRRFDTGGYFYVIETSIGTFRGSFSILRE